MQRIDSFVLARKFLLLYFLLSCAFQDSFSQYKTERPPYEDFLNYGRKRLKPDGDLENEIIGSKVDVLGEVFKKHVHQLRNAPGQRVELVFLVDSSASVGVENFFNELKFVRKLLADFTVSYNQTRVAVITFSSRRKVLRPIDHVTHAKEAKHKCSLLEQELPRIRYSGGGTYTLGALLEAQAVLAIARPDARKAVFLVTDGYSNGGDPRPAAEYLKKRGVIIFTFGIQNGNVKELYDMASEPREEHSYILDSFEEFEALARRALHEDLHSGIMITQDPQECDSLCPKGLDCCDENARCACGTHTGFFACTCERGFYGTGLKGDCRPCPSGTFRDTTGPGDVNSCNLCPDPNMSSLQGSTSPTDCFCLRGFKQVGLKCQKLTCPILKPPENGYFVRNKCESIVNAACGMRCNTGYMLRGSSIRLCREDGLWSGTDTVCQLKSCPALKTPKNGVMSCDSTNTTVDTKCNFACKRGYQLIGSRTRTCLAVSMWDGIRAFCRPYFCKPLQKVKDGIINPPSCTTRKIQYGTKCEYSCNFGFQLIGAAKTTCGDKGIWTDNAIISRCIDIEPPIIQCPRGQIYTTEKRENYAVVDWDIPIAKDQSKGNVHLTTIPATNPPLKLKIGVHNITYIAKDDWNNEANCSFTIIVNDEEPPTVDWCESPPTFLAREENVHVYWEEPIFSDNSEGHIQVTRSKEPGEFHQGETLVEYLATDEHDNSASCNITIKVQKHACDLPHDPINGVANCTENPEAVYCTLTCEDGYAFAMRPQQDYFCTYDGLWQPDNNPLPFPDCSVSSMSNSISQTGEMAMDGPSTSVCDDIFFMGQVENELEKKLIKALDDVCADDILCEVATVEAVCEELLEEAEEAYNTLGSSRKKRNLDTSESKIQWPFELDSNWIYWTRGDSVNFQRHSRRKRELLSNENIEVKVRKKRQFGFPPGFLEDKKKEPLNKERENQVGVLINMVLESLGKDIGMIRFTSFLSKLGSKGGSSTGDFLSAFSKEFGEEKTRDVMKLAKDRFDLPVPAALVDQHGKPAESSKEEASDKTQNPQTGSKTLKTDSVVSHGESDAAVNTKVDGAMMAFADQKLFVKFNIKADGKENVPEKVDQTMKKLLKFASDGHFDVDFGMRQLRVAAIRLNEELKYICQPGSVSQGDLCVKCPVGTFFNVIEMVCQPCPPGSYQPKEGQVSCLVCPRNTSTRILQAKSEHDCKAMCLPGSFSRDTLEPCTTCSLGEYQDEYASRSCSSCPYGTTTWRRGSWFLEECKSLCPPGSISETGLEPCLPCPKNYFQDVGGKSQCLKCPGESYTGREGSQSITDCFGIQADDALAAYSSLETLPVNDCFSLPCKHGSNCRSMEFGFVCDCTPGYTGQHCENEVDECSSHPCLNNGTCLDKFNSFECDCASGFEGLICEKNIDDCLSHACVNEGTCVDLVDDYKCLCEAGFNGKFCETNIDDCLVSSCSSGSTCVDGISDYTCLCPPGFSGRHCEVEIDECQSSPCLHGSCTDLVGRYSCTCETGYSGSQCEINIDDCLSDPCLNNGTCTDWIEGFSCSCLPGFTGKTCDTEMSTKFMLEFSTSGIMDYSKLEGFPRDLDAVSVCFWMKTHDKDNYGTPFSYATDKSDNVFTLTDYNGFVLYLNEEKRITDVSANDGKWHMICVTWESQQGSWAIYKDSILIDSGKNLSRGKVIEGNGAFVLGQEQDEKGGKYSAPESFVGEIYSFNIWGEALPPERVVDLFWRCSRYVGDIRAWPDFQEGVMGGGIKLKKSIFCRGCTFPFVPAHAKLIQEGTSPGSVVEISCDVGHKLYGDKTRVCQIDGRYSGKEPECTAVSCGYPERFRKGDITGTNFEYGGVIVYTCKTGLRLNGDARRTCQADGKWSGSTPTCEVISCSSPVPIQNGKVVSNLDPYLPTNKVAYTCYDGYQMDGPAFQTCGRDGEWKGEGASCQPINCDSQPIIKNGHLDNKGPILTGFPVRVICNPGFKLKGSEGVACNSDGKWPEKLPKCISETCVKPPYIENGTVKIRASVTGKEAYYRCDDGFTLKGAKYLHCTSDGEWDAPYPTCVPPQCTDPEVPQHGRVIQVDQWVIGTQAVYECDPGFKISGNKMRNCIEDFEEGKWEGDLPSCEVIECPSLNDIAGGSYYIRNKAPKPGIEINFPSPGSDVELLRRKRSEFPSISHSQSSYDYEEFDTGQTMDFGGQSSYDYGEAQGLGKAYSIGQSFDYIQSADYAGGEFGQSPGEFDDFGQSMGQSPEDYGDFGQSMGHSPEDYGDFGQSMGQSPGDYGDFGQSMGQTPEDYEDFDQSPISTISGLIISPNYYNTTAKYDCRPGYKLLGSRVRRCSETGDWDVPEPRCYEQFCPELRVLENGHLIYHGSGSHSKVEFSCNEGYELVGDPKLHCQSDGTWLGKEPICQMLDCGKPPIPENGTVDFNSTTYGSFAIYDCDSGFVLEGSFERYCGLNSFWNGSMPRCVSVICKVPPVIQDGYITFEGSLYAGSSIEYECKECFKLNGANIRECQLNGTWSLEQPSCKLIYCDPLPLQLENGKIIGSDNSCGSLVEYECHPGYNLKGRRKATCRENAKWSSNPPTCEKVECGAPSRIPNGKAVGNSYEFMDNVTYECNKGHNPIGNTVIVCNENGKWSGSPPICNIVYCKKPKGPSNGRVRLSGLFYQSYASIVCDSGFTLDGIDKIVCQENGHWDQEMPYCRPIICEQAPRISHAHYNSSELYFEAFTTLSYKCDEGYYSLENTNILSCNATGSWEGEEIQCLPVDCGAPPNLASRVVSGDVFTYGNALSFSCDEGYQLLGANTSACLASGKWSHNATCKIIKCQPLPDFDHGTMLTDDILSQYGAAVYFQCDDGYILIGNSNITCDEEGKWSDSCPICKPVSCPEPPETIETFIHGNIYEFQQQISYTCSKGFYLDGEQNLTCQANGKWSADFPFCEMIMCNEPEEIEFGNWSNLMASNISETAKNVKKEDTKKLHPKGHATSVQVAKFTSLFEGSIELFKYRSGHKIQYTCHDGYFMTTDGLLECTKSGWNAHLPQCHPITCPLPISIRNGKVVGEEVTYKSLLEYECNEGFDLFGPRNRTCQANKKWTDTEPYCRPVECPPPASLTNGQTHGKDFKYQAMLTYTCDSGFRLEGDVSRTCQSNGYWTGAQPECIEIFCDAPTQVANSVLDITSLKVGGTARYSCMDGYKMDGKAVLNCQGDGVWDEASPNCVQIDCGSPPSNPHLTAIHSSTIYGSKVSYSCARGYKLIGQDRSNCLSDGKWSDSPTCEEILCDLPITPINVAFVEYQDMRETDVETSFEKLLVSPKNDVNAWKKGAKNQGEASKASNKIDKLIVSKVYKVDEQIHYSCDIGWIPDGDMKRTCTEAGSWSAQPPSCKRIFCGPPSLPKRAKYSGEDFSFGGTVIFSCIEGYSLNGSDSITCGADGKWSNPYPECLPKDCGPPKLPENGRVEFQLATHGLTTHFGSNALIFCKEGYELVGSKLMSCSSDGNWEMSSSQVASCKEVRCDDPPSVIHGTSLEVPGSFPQQASYACQPGYNLVGNPEIHCHLGHWEGFNVSCEPVNCFEPPIPENGKITAKHFLLGSVANYSCVEGYSTNGHYSIECGIEGLWIGAIPLCERVDCGSPELMEHGIGHFISTDYASKVDYACKEGFELKGQGQRVCGQDGKWSGHLPQCYRISCGEVSPPKNGFVIGARYLFGDEIKFTCRKGFLLEGNEVSRCLDSGKWAEPLPTCKAVSCGPPPFINNMDSDIEKMKSEFKYENVVHYTCQKGYIARGDLTSRCLADGSWSDVRGKCSRSACGRPVISEEGAIILGRSYYYKDRVRVSCPPGTKPHGTSTMTCLDTGKWSEGVTCVKGCKSKCLNGGVCLSNNICSCPSGYKGRRCQKAVCLLPCLNGGKCIAPYKCSCPTGYSGQRCQNPVCEFGCGHTGRCIGPNVCLCSYGRTDNKCNDDEGDYYNYDQEEATFYDDWDIAALRRKRFGKYN